MSQSKSSPPLTRGVGAPLTLNSNPADPDLSNPTRPRLERPLDTIRSFEAAVHETYNNRNSASLKSREFGAMHYHVQQSLTYPAGGESTPGDVGPRGSYFGGGNDRYGPSRRESYADGYNQPSENYYPYNRNSRSRPRYSRRMTTDKSLGGGSARNGYAVNGYQNAHQDAYQPGYQGSGSYDNITAASGSGSRHTDPYGNSTDPSSVDSSIDQLQQHQHQQQQRQQQQQQQQKSMHGDYGYNQPTAPAPQPPPKHVFGTAPAPDPNSGGPVRNGAAAQGGRRHLRKSTNVSEMSTGDGKRKSWFKRRFSKT